MQSRTSTPLSYFVQSFNTFYAPFASFFMVYRHDISETIKSYLSGLLRQIGRKNIERIQEHTADISYHALQHAVSDSPWDAAALSRQVAREANRRIGTATSVLVLDDSSTSKKGSKSVGVARQWNGRLGKIDNCQVGVYACLSSKRRYALVGYRLYLPEKWSTDRRRCEQAGIPVEQRQCKSKTELGLELVDQARQDQLCFSMVVGDSTYGVLKFAHDLQRRGQRFALDLRISDRLYRRDPEPYVPAPTGKRGKPCTKERSSVRGVSIKTIIRQIRTDQWQRIRVSEGTKGTLYVQAYEEQVYFWNAECGESPVQWRLVITRDEGSKDLKYFMSNAEAGMSLATLVRRRRQRFWVERSFQDAKSCLGMADYQVRSWQAWHHHMALVMLAMLFMLTLKLDHTDPDTRHLSCEDILIVMQFLLPSPLLTECDVFELIKNRQKKRLLNVKRLT
jgi:SRSO17 transposase